MPTETITPTANPPTADPPTADPPTADPPITPTPSAASPDNITFDPSLLIPFTNFIIEKSMADVQFNFTIFPFFMKFLLPFNKPADCIEHIGNIDVAPLSDFKNYSNYFKSLFNYYNLLNKKHLIQQDIIALFTQISMKITSPDTGPNPTQTQGTATQVQERLTPFPSDLVDKIKNNYVQIKDLNRTILEASKEFNRIKKWQCEDLHSFLLLKTPDPTLQETFVLDCTSHMFGTQFFIDPATLSNDSPEIVFKKFVWVICNNFYTDASFNDAKFWVLSQLFTRL